MFVFPASHTSTREQSHCPVLSQARLLRLQGFVPLVFRTQLHCGLGTRSAVESVQCEFARSGQWPLPVTNAENERIAAGPCRFYKRLFSSKSISSQYASALGKICRGGSVPPISTLRLVMDHPEFGVGDVVTTLFSA